MKQWVLCAAALSALGAAMPATAQQYTETPATVTPATTGWNYERRTAEIPMRDGVTLHTVILVPKGARGAPMLMTRTPYNAEGLTRNFASGNLVATLDGYDNAADVIVEGGYIRVVQDIRGKYGSGGDYVMNRPLVGNPLNPTKVDDSTDAYDTIDWLVKHVPESNGRVGVIGISYDGYEALVPLINPHPALKVAVPMNPMVDGWRGDDWFQNGAFRQLNAPYVFEQEAARDNSVPFTVNTYDLYDAFMRDGSAGEFGRAHGIDQVGFWREIIKHPAYDSFWESQAMDKILAAQPLKVPTMLVDSLWDAEDIYGALAVYRAVEPKDTNNDMLYLTMGPWWHGQGIHQGRSTGQIQWDQDTAKYWRNHVLAPFLAHYLKDAPMDVAPVTAFQSGANRWQRLNSWPAARASQRLYLKPAATLGFQPAAGAPATADYWSDPAHPVTFTPRPIRPSTYEDDHWQAWLTTDQREYSTRPDVLTFTGPVLSQAVTVAGAPVVHLTASTSGTDSDWVVKLIDVYPDEIPVDRYMSGYQFPIAMQIFRGRYRESLGEPKPLKPNVPLAYSFDLPTTNHVFLPGHRIMVQVQSSWFPLYDRNPQTFVQNIFFARPADYVVARQKVVVAGPEESYIELPVTG
jgi:putative CocE/NonD family hydrolase